MNIKNHGEWQVYKPSTLPEGAPPNAMFARRESDGLDWYAYVHPGTNFEEGSIKMTVVNGTVAAATKDATALFPGGATVLEVIGVTEDDPQAAFGRKVYVEASQNFVDPPPQDFPNPIADLLKRIEALEGKG